MIQGRNWANIVFSGLSNPVGSPSGDKWQRSKLVVIKILECGIVVAISLAPRYILIPTKTFINVLFSLSCIPVGIAFI